MKIFALPTATLLCGSVLLLTATGCGTSVYGEKFSKRLAELELSSPFSVLSGPTVDLPINFRIPLQTPNAYDRSSAHPADQNKRIIASRLAPPFMMEFPGLRMMYEGQVVGAQLQKLPVYCYIGEGETASVKGKFPYDMWLAWLKRTFPATKAWESIDVTSPTGKKLTWKRLVCKGKQEFDVDDNGRYGYENIDGVFQLWVYETPQWIVTVGWRAPTDAADKIKLEDLAKLTAGTATINTSYVMPNPKGKGGKDKAGAVQPPASIRRSPCPRNSARHFSTDANRPFLPVDRQLRRLTVSFVPPEVIRISTTLREILKSLQDIALGHPSRREVVTYFSNT